MDFLTPHIGQIVGTGILLFCLVLLVLCYRTSERVDDTWDIDDDREEQP